MSGECRCIVRNATPGDAKGISDVHVAGIKHGHKGTIDQTFLTSLNSSSQSVKYLKNIIEEGSSILLVSEEDSKINGFIHGGLPNDNPAPYDYEVYSFYVEPSCQGKGIGAKLFNAFFKEANTESIYLWSFPGSTGDIFYQHKGGKAFGTKDKEIGGKMYKNIGYFWELKK